ncbi:MAG: hypothetical protein K0S65_5160, partial [Labilithrix sp.]|nr:hypothetical protein [Labilithrix sp.]
LVASAMLGTLGTLAACGDDTSKGTAADGGTTNPPGTSPTTTPTALPDGATPDAGKRSCLDRPNTLPRSPSSGLPCELIPPGLTL